MTWFCYLLFSENTRRTYIGARGRASVIASAAVVTTGRRATETAIAPRDRPTGTRRRASSNPAKSRATSILYSLVLSSRH